MQENKTPVNEAEKWLAELEKNNPEEYEQIKKATAQMVAAAAAWVQQAAETARQFIADFAVNIQPSLDEIAEQINESWAAMLKACEDAEIYPPRIPPPP